MLQWFSEKKQMGVAWLLLFLMLFSVGSSVVSVRAAGSGFRLCGDKHDPVFNTFMIYGRHHFDDGEDGRTAPRHLMCPIWSVPISPILPKGQR